MATSAFRSTSKRTSIGASPTSTNISSSSNRSFAYRRSRSLSRFSRPMPDLESPFSDEAPAPRARFVNTMRGSGFPEINLDELAIDFFSSGDRGRSASKNADANPRKSETASQRRGRSVSRHSSRIVGGGGVDRGSSVYNASIGQRAVSENHSRRRRSVSVVRCPISDSESDLDFHNASSHTKTKNFSNGNSQKALSGEPTTTCQRPSLRRLSSQRDLKSYNDDSSDLDLSHNASAQAKKKNFSNGDGQNQKASLGKLNTTSQRQLLRSFSQKDLKSYDCDSSQSSALTADEADRPISDDVNGALYEAMRKDLRCAVEEIRMEIGQDRVHGTSLPKSGHKQSAKDDEVLNTDSYSLRKNHAMKSDQLLEKKRANNKKRMSKWHTEEAEKYIEEFISNIEDTDISSIDGGERSDTSSTLGGGVGVVKLDSSYHQTPPVPPPTRGALPLEMDGVVLPWLQWEIGNDVTPQSSKQEMIMIESTAAATIPKNAHQESKNERGGGKGNYSISSQGSCTPGTAGFTTTARSIDLGSRSRSSRRIDPDDYLNIKSDEDLIFERWSQHQRISSGGLLLCNHRMSLF